MALHCKSTVISSYSVSISIMASHHPVSIHCHPLCGIVGFVTLCFFPLRIIMIIIVFLLFPIPPHTHTCSHCSGATVSPHSHAGSDDVSDGSGIGWSGQWYSYTPEEAGHGHVISSLIEIPDS